MATRQAVASGLAFHLMSIYLPLSRPPLRLRKPDIVPLALPDDPGRLPYPDVLLRSYSAINELFGEPIRVLLAATHLRNH